MMRLLSLVRWVNIIVIVINGVVVGMEVMKVFGR